MKTKVQSQLSEKLENLKLDKPFSDIDTAISASWSKIAPLWPLKNFIAVNPLQGFQGLNFEEALKQAKAYFQTKNLPENMGFVNRLSIKWLQAFFDSGQSTIQMPMRHLGFLKSVFSFLQFDTSLKLKDTKRKKWIQELPNDARAIIAKCLLYLGVPSNEQEQFLTLMLTTLPGWAAYIQYRTNWADHEDAKNPYYITQKDYLAFRLVLTCLVYPKAKELILWHKKALNSANTDLVYKQIEENEKTFQKNLFEKLDQSKKPKAKKRSDAQLVFCIDVRSEPFRKAIEAQGNYETFGFAGFFGLPVSIENNVTQKEHASCPVLLKPTHKITEKSNRLDEACKKGHKKLLGFKKLYQSLKYTFTTPFSLVETIGIASGFWMGLKSFSPMGSKFVRGAFKKALAPNYQLLPDLNSIRFETQVAFGSNALKMMGMTADFAPLVVFCGHGSTTQNNAYASALNCGACGGNRGAPNARILAQILNEPKVRIAIEKEHQILIPKDTLFLGAEHNTTTDEVNLFNYISPHFFDEKIKTLKNDLEMARETNSFWRCCQMGVKVPAGRAKKMTALRSQDWAQVRPEWGLAKNAAFIIAPRWVTKEINLEGRSFLHSYEWEKDEDATSLKGILSGPMIVTQWINSQYLFSTLDNVAFGSGSKTTKNVTGKIGIMQGNASDLFHGLPLQSVYKKDHEPYHQPLRLTVVLYAPRFHIDLVLKEDANLQKILVNSWLHLICYEPQTEEKFKLQKDLSWLKLT